MQSDPRTDTPVAAFAEVLDADRVRATAACIAAVQHDDGSIPWSIGQHVDVWNHVEAAMALLVGGQVEAAERAYDWCLRVQRHDGSWPMKWVDGEVPDPSGETNMSAYLAVGAWHHWLVRGDRAYLEHLWPAVRSGLDFVVGLQLDFGGIAWRQEWDADGPAAAPAEALLAGSSSIYHALRAGVALAELLDRPQPHWEVAGGRLGHALRCHRDLFEDKSTFSMDWYYPVLGGAVRGEDGRRMLRERWQDFVVPGRGIRCVDTNPWVTGAETCELVMALEAVGCRDQAVRLFTDMQMLRAGNGDYWTGWVYPDDAFWPDEQTTYTNAAVILAADVLGDATPGADVMRGDTMAPSFADLPSGCGCAESEPETEAERLLR